MGCCWKCRRPNMTWRAWLTKTWYHLHADSAMIIGNPFVIQVNVANALSLCDQKRPLWVKSHQVSDWVCRVHVPMAHGHCLPVIACQNIHNGHWPCSVSSVPGAFRCIQLSHPELSFVVHSSKWLDCLSVVALKSHFTRTSWIERAHCFLILFSDVIASSSFISTESKWNLCNRLSTDLWRRTRGNSHWGVLQVNFSPSFSKKTVSGKCG